MQDFIKSIRSLVAGRQQTCEACACDACRTILNLNEKINAESQSFASLARAGEVSEEAVKQYNERMAKWQNGVLALQNLHFKEIEAIMKDMP